MPAAYAIHNAREQMKPAPRKTKKTPTVRLPRKNASYTELSNFFDTHDGVDLLNRGVMEIDPDREDLDRMRRESMQP